jgi:hypothetical protein
VPAANRGAKQKADEVAAQLHALEEGGDPLPDNPPDNPPDSPPGNPPDIPPVIPPATTPGSPIRAETNPGPTLGSEESEGDNSFASPKDDSSEEDQDLEEAEEGKRKSSQLKSIQRKGAKKRKR